MVDLKEIRIGNYITSKSSKNLYWEIFPSDMEIIVSKPEHYLPIKITEDILIKLGAYWEDIITEKDILVIDIDENISIGWCGYLFLVINSSCIFFNESNSIYLHQLQNLYRDLKREDLQIPFDLWESNNIKK